MQIPNMIPPWIKKADLPKGEVSQHGVLIRKYGVGKIPIDELHSINCILSEDWEHEKAEQEYKRRREAAQKAERIRHDKWADEYSAGRRYDEF